MQKRVTFWAVLLLAVALIFSGCTSRLDAGSMVERDSDELFVDLPAIVIDYASDGTASIGGLSQCQLAIKRTRMAAFMNRTRGQFGSYFDSFRIVAATAMGTAFYCFQPPTHSGN